ncbi:CidA/LrgA family protein [Phaeovulum vinaykumarii]|uniref:Putative effector of murein hydrolase LrgA, UPF0299 family n=1 Tax=Phaeovulum vinaykumarii TaxID=407234 RepID=A0A1N7LX20_9RHOB|nr:CidA/LrgA family protein [Phaeovulum vinaykumarii]SIS78367.1 Putative effector of murein hydrolase LrgA, UPF0299 family [Phaeovulum vinaykumarii]SOC07060.1 putative effector of murein hydrolase LrgA (UPF0299 family) [Phaeovulum vinaykumarii]
MTGVLTLIFACQLAGEFVVSVLALPLPGPVLGMVFLFTLLMIRGGVSEPLSEVAGGLGRAMSLLFVPAGTGVMLHFRELGQEIAPLGLSILVSTVLAIAVTGLAMSWLGRATRADAEGTRDD